MHWELLFNNPTIIGSDSGSIRRPQQGAGIALHSKQLPLWKYLSWTMAGEPATTEGPLDAIAQEIGWSWALPPSVDACGITRGLMASRD